jgi:hypothetical protein
VLQDRPSGRSMTAPTPAKPRVAPAAAKAADSPASAPKADDSLELLGGLIGAILDIF